MDKGFLNKGSSSVKATKKTTNLADQVGRNTDNDGSSVKGSNTATNLADQVGVNMDTNPYHRVDGFKVVQNRKAKPQGPKLSSGINMGKGPKFAPRKQVYIPKKKTPDVNATGTPVTTSNSFGTLEVHEDTAIQSPVIDSNTEEAMIGDSTGCSKEADVDKGRIMEVNEDVFNKTGSTSHVPLVSDSMGTMDVGSTPIVEKIGKLEKLLIAGKATLVDDDGQPIPSTSFTKRANPFSKVGEIVVSDSEDEVVANPFDESANLFGGGQGYEDEYDEYDFDDYSKQVRDLPGNLDVFNAMYGTTFQGPRK